MDPKNVVKIQFRNVLVQAVESVFDPRVVNVEGVKEAETFIFKPTTRSHSRRVPADFVHVETRG